MSKKPKYNVGHTMSLLDDEREKTKRLGAELDALRKRLGPIEKALEWAHDSKKPACACGEDGEHPEDCPVATALARLRSVMERKPGEPCDPPGPTQL